MGLSNAKSFHPFCQIKRHLFGINKQSCKDKNVMLFCTKISPLFTKSVVCLQSNILLRPNMLGVFITLSQSLCLGYRGICSIIWPQSTGGGSPQTFLCICSLKMCICNFHTFALKPVAFLPPILSTGMEALFPIFCM